MKENMGFLIFIFFIIVFILLLTGDRIIKSFRKVKRRAKRTAAEKELKYREETGRQQNQYYYNGGTTSSQPFAEQEKILSPEEPLEVHTKTATGETIIDRREKKIERENKKIYENTDGEYVEFSEEEE